MVDAASVPSATLAPTNTLTVGVWLAKFTSVVRPQGRLETVGVDDREHHEDAPRTCRQGTSSWVSVSVASTFTTGVPGTDKTI